MKLDNKVILLTGGTGSFGYQFVKTVLKQHRPKVIRIFSRDEFKQHQMANQFNNDNRLRFLVGDVRDKDRLDLSMRGVDLVVHAAALKQVPICEYNPFEAIKTNVLGTENVIRAAIGQRVTKVMNISSDKAVNPINLYGATKLCAEKLCIQGNNYVGDRQVTLFSSCRYGNVLGSRGSVIELFQKQKQKGEVTVTDKRMTRFWLNIEKGVQFVISAIERMEGGEVFVPKIPTMSLLKLAQTIAPNAIIKEIGIRPGEKIHEVLISEDESRDAFEFPDCYIVFSSSLGRKYSYLVEGKPLKEGFQYRSDLNQDRLTAAQLKAFL